MENAASPQTMPASPAAPKRKKKRREPSIVEEFEALAKKGDFEGLIDGYASEWGFHLTAKQKGELIRRALKAHVRRGGTPAVISALLEQILMFDAEFLFALQHSVRRKMNAQSNQTEMSPGMIDSVVEDDLPKLTVTEDRVIELCRAIGSIRHTLALAETPRPQSKNPRVLKLDPNSRRSPAKEAAGG